MIREHRARTKLTGRAKTWSPLDYELREKGRLAARLNLAWIWERGTLVIGDRTWELGREGWFNGAFFLKEQGRVAASAEKPSVFFRSFQVRFDHTQYCWEADSAFTQTFLLFQHSLVVGSMRAVSQFTQGSAIDLPAELPLERKVFLVWLTILMWRRQNSG